MSGARLYILREKTLAGELLTADYDDYRFTYHPDYLSGGNPPLSLSLPLQAGSIKNQRVQVFFDGLLPEGEEREAFANHLRVPPFNTEALLIALCGECIGNLTILTEAMLESGGVGTEGGYTPLSKERFLGLVGSASAERIQAELSSRISLAGGQAKIGLYFNDYNSGLEPQGIEGWFLPFGMAPSSHILKSSSERFPALAENEAFCMALAGACNINVAKTTLLYANAPVLAVERFDRTRNADTAKAPGRLFQEDACQISGILSLHKYEASGGPGFVLLHDIIRRWSLDVIEDSRALMRLALFNYLIGNCDAHGKNFSLLACKDGGLRLAPAYDLVSTTCYPKLSQEMAMRFGAHSRLSHIDGQDIQDLAKTLGLPLRQAGMLLGELLEQMHENATSITAALCAHGFAKVEAVAAQIMAGFEERRKALQTGR